MLQLQIVLLMHLWIEKKYQLKGLMFKAELWRQEGSVINRLAVCVSDCLMLCIVEAVLDSLTLFLFSTRTALFPPFFFFWYPPLFCFFECLYICTCIFLFIIGFLLNFQFGSWIFIQVLGITVYGITGTVLRLCEYDFFLVLIEFSKRINLANF